MNTIALNILALGVVLLPADSVSQLSTTDSAKIRHDYWRAAVYVPTPQDALGEYSWHNGYSSGTLSLEDSSVFLASGTSDVIIEGFTPTGLKGRYAIHGDTLFLTYVEYAIPGSSSAERRDKLLRRQRAAMAKLNSEETPYLCRKVGEHVFLVRPDDEKEFCQSAFRKSKIPGLRYYDYRVYGDRFLLKAEYRDDPPEGEVEE